MLIIDSHLDLAWNALQWNRDLLQSVYTLRTREHSGPPGPGRGMNTVAFPELRQGRVAVCFATLLARSTGIPSPHIDYGSAAQAYGIARGQLDYYRALEAQGYVRIITNLKELNHHIQEWQDWDSKQTPDPSTTLKADNFSSQITSRSAQDAIPKSKIGESTLSGVRLRTPEAFAKPLVLSAETIIPTIEVKDATTEQPHTDSTLSEDFAKSLVLSEIEVKGAGYGDTPPIGLIISMESADPILSPNQLESWHHAGVRAIGPAHYGPGRYAGGTGTELPLTPDGITLLQEMEHLGILLDLTHFSDPAFWQALDLYSGPVLASHNNCRALVPHQRQFSDDQLKAIIERGGVIGVAFDSWMLQLDWNHGVFNENIATLADVVNHMDHICQLAGNTHHAALGTDLDGGFGREESPLDLDTIADLQKIPAMLAERGYTDADLANIMHGNWLNFLRRVWTKI